jgi:hypothetical protein
MINYKLQIDDFDEVDYSLIAIHTALDDYRLAYFINKNLSINLSKNENEIPISVKDGETFFTRFDFEDFENGVLWSLIQNENEIIIKKKGTNFDLFADTIQEISKKVHLLPDFKKVNYFLKINNTETYIDLSKTTEILNTIDRISTVYIVDLNKIKNKNNLIF